VRFIFIDRYNYKTSHKVAPSDLFHVPNVKWAIDIKEKEKKFDQLLEELERER